MRAFLLKKHEEGEKRIRLVGIQGLEKYLFCI